MDVTCLDLSPYYLAEARANLARWARLRAPGLAMGGVDGNGAAFLQAAAEKIPQPDASFDAVRAPSLAGTLLRCAQLPIQSAAFTGCASIQRLTAQSLCHPIRTTCGYLMKCCVHPLGCASKFLHSWLSVSVLCAQVLFRRHKSKKACVILEN